MNKMVSAVKSFVADENGVTAIEYGLIAALVGVAIVGTVTLLGGRLNDTFEAVKNAIVLPAAP